MEIDGQDGKPAEGESFIASDLKYEDWIWHGPRSRSVKILLQTRRFMYEFSKISSLCRRSDVKDDLV